MQGGDSCRVIAAGLPNITGTIVVNSGEANGAINAASSTGAFSAINDQGDGTWNAGAQGPRASLGFTATFSASKANQIYGASSTVQPPNITLIPQIRF